MKGHRESDEKISIIDIIQYISTLYIQVALNIKLVLFIETLETE